jgi:hypothetical protein
MGRRGSPATAGTHEGATACAACGYANSADAPVCGLCGEVLGIPAPQGGAAADPAPTHRAASPGLDARPAWRDGFDEQQEDRRPGEGHGERLLTLGLGALIAPAFALLPIVSFMGWFLAALCHELGHSITAWAFAMPAYPAIRIDGNAVCIHEDQKTIVFLLIEAGWIAGAWFFRGRPALLAACAVGAVLYPALASWVTIRELLFLVGGHLGELGFATVFLWRALDGGFSESRAERVLYAALGSYLVGAHAVLCFGLMTSAVARDAYAANGSFGLANDYIRVAEDVVGCGLPTVAAAMLLVTLVPIPLAVGLWWMQHREERA